MGISVCTTDSGNVKRFIFQNADGTSSSFSVSKKSNGKSINNLKKLQYNFKKVSARILRSKTSGSAGQAVIMARTELTRLKRKKLKSGEYDDSELETAIIHAEKMVRIAKKKEKHLREEEEGEKSAAKRDNEFDSGDELYGIPEADSDDAECELKTQSIKDSEELMRKLQKLFCEFADYEEDTDITEELSDVQTEAFEDIEPSDLEMRKKKHRSDELREIMKADLKYLKAMFDKLEKERQNAAGCVTLQLGGIDMPVMTSQPAPSVITEGAEVDVSV